MPDKSNADGRETRIHLVPAPRPNERRLSLGNYTADIVVSKREESCCYYVVQRIGFPEIIDMQRSDTVERAEVAAKAALERWNSEGLFSRTAS